MTQTLTEYKKILCSYIVPGTLEEYEEEEETDEDDVEIEEGFVELELGDETLMENVEWLYEEELEAQIDGPFGPVIIKKGRFAETI